MKTLRCRLLISAVAAVVCASCGSREDKEYIECFLPLCVWQDNAETIVHNQLMSVAKDLKDYAEASLDRYKSKSEQEDSDRFTRMSLLGLGLLYSSNHETVESNIEKYVDHFETVVNDLKDAMYYVVESQDGAAPAEDIPTGNALARLLLGTPEKPSSVSSEDMQKIGNALVQQVLVIYPDIILPEILSCRYDLKNGCWVVKFLDAHTQYVRVFEVGDDKEYRYTDDLSGDDCKTLELR